MILMVTEFLYLLGEKNEEFKKSLYYHNPNDMFENHDVTFSRIADGYLLWIQITYGDKWTEYIGDMVYGEVNGKMTIYVPDEDGGVLAR